MKIAMEERRLLLAQRNLESIRLIAELLARAKVRAEQGDWSCDVPVQFPMHLLCLLLLRFFHHRVTECYYTAIL